MSTIILRCYLRISPVGLLCITTHYLMPLTSLPATFPLDLFKTRLQLQGEVALDKSAHNGGTVVTPRKGLFAIARGIGELHLSCCM